MNKEIENLFDHINSKASSDGVDCELMAVSTEKFSASFQKKEMEKFGFSSTQSLGLRVIKNGREGSAYTESRQIDDLEKCYQQALASSALIEKPYQPELLPPSSEKLTDLNLFSESLAQVTVDDRLETAKLLEETALDSSNFITAVPYNGYSDFISEVTLLNSKGVQLTSKQNGCSASVYPLAKKDELTGMASEYSFSRDLKSLNIKDIANKAAEEAVFKLESQVPATGIYNIVLKNTAAASFVQLLAGHFSAKSADQKTSLFTNSRGKQIASALFSLTDDPHLDGSFGSRSFDDEGQSTKVNSLISKGVFEGFLTNSAFAKKLNLKNTASASRSPKSELGIQTTNLVVDPGDKSFDELVGVSPTVIVIDNLKGMAGVNAVSGDFSIESEGLLFNNGQLKHGLKNFVVSGNILEVLNSIKLIGNDVRLTLSGVSTPSLYIGELSVAGS